MIYILRTQKETLLGCFEKDMIGKMEDDFKQFKYNVQVSSRAQDSLSTCSNKYLTQWSVFESVWDCFKNRFLLLHKFFRGLSAVDLSVL